MYFIHFFLLITALYASQPALAVPVLRSGKSLNRQSANQERALASSAQVLFSHSKRAGASSSAPLGSSPQTAGKSKIAFTRSTLAPIKEILDENAPQIHKIPGILSPQAAVSRLRVPGASIPPALAQIDEDLDENVPQTNKVPGKLSPKAAVSRLKTESAFQPSLATIKEKPSSMQMYISRSKTRKPFTRFTLPKAIQEVPSPRIMEAPILQQPGELRRTVSLSGVSGLGPKTVNVIYNPKGLISSFSDKSFAEIDALRAKTVPVPPGASKAQKTASFLRKHPGDHRRSAPVDI